MSVLIIRDWLSFTRLGYLIHSRHFERDDLDHNLSGKVCLVTGGSSGIGKAAAKSLAERGAEVWILSRDKDRGLEAVDQLRDQTKNHHIELVTIDVSDLHAVQKFCDNFPRNHVDILIHNAGTIFSTRQFTAQNLEQNFASSVVGPYLLTAGLLSRLKSSEESRVIFVSSAGMYTQKLDLGRLQGLGNTSYNDRIAYAQAKRAQVILAEMLATKLKETKVTVHSMHPGWVDTLGIRKYVLRTTEQGADTIVWLAVCPRASHNSGQFWLDREPYPTHWMPNTRETSAEREMLAAICNQAISALTNPAFMII